MLQRVALAGLILAALLAEFRGAPAGPARRPLQPPSPRERAELRFRENGPHKAAIQQALQEALLTPPDPVDVQRYLIDLKVIPASSRVEGTVRMQAAVLTNGLTAVDVGLYDALAVSSITRGPMPLAYTRSDNTLHISLDRPYVSGETIDIAIGYAGTPPVVGYGSFTFRTHNPLDPRPIISSLSEPTYAPSWWPCIDKPSDKAIVEMNLNVPGDLVGVSNGVLAGTAENPDGTRTYQWRSAYPISTYLVSVAISNYATWTDIYEPVTGGPPMPVQHWVYPEHLAEARRDFADTVPQLAFFSGLFGEYPFVDEKYGHAIFPFNGGMEHQSATSYGASLIRGDNRYYWIVAHELAHQWWGDSVTLSSWKETWLNEGFASYSEALWYEHLNGPQGLRAYMAGFDSRPFCGTLADPGACDPFGHTVYDKGAWVLHMLRRVVGEAAFFQGLRDYASDFAMSNVTTRDVQATMEAASGRALASFFDRWIYQSGEPLYRYGWTAAATPGGWVTHVRVEQAQDGALFEMPIDLRVTMASGSFTITVQNDAAAQDYALPPAPDRPSGVALDPDGWILKSTAFMTLPDADGDGVPDTADNCDQSANPAQEDLDRDDLGDACDPDIDGDGRANAADCAPSDASAQDLPSEATGLAAAGGGALSLSWDPDPAQGAGLTFEVLRGDAASLAIDAGAASADCLAVGLDQPAASDAAVPAPGGSFYYLVRKRNACGAGPLGTASSGDQRFSSVCP